MIFSQVLCHVFLHAHFMFVNGIIPVCLCKKYPGSRPALFIRQLNSCVVVGLVCLKLEVGAGCSGVDSFARVASFSDESILLLSSFAMLGFTVSHSSLLDSQTLICRLSFSSSYLMFLFSLSDKNRIIEVSQSHPINFLGISSLIPASGFPLRSMCLPRFLAYLVTWSRVATVLNTISASSQMHSLVPLLVPATLLIVSTSSFICKFMIPILLLRKALAFAHISG